MNFNEWPQWKRDQYNEQRMKMKLKKRFHQRREEVLNARHTPAIWSFPLNEENVFKMLAYSFPLNETISKILQRFFSSDGHRDLLLSSRYLFETRRIFPGYYSDRERIVVMLNRLRATEDFREFINWLPFHESKRNSHLLYLIIGVLFLDQYLHELNAENTLDISIHYFQKCHAHFESDEGELAHATLLAFCLYMRQDFKSSILYLKSREENELQAKFGELLKRVG